MARPDEAAPGVRAYYTRVAIWLHWIIALIVILNLVGGIVHEWLPRDLGRLVIGTHKTMGLIVLALSLVRLAWRLAHKPPPLPPMPRWQVGAAHSLHWLFYILIVLMPLSGWVFTSAAVKRYPLTFFGLFDLPYLPVSRGPEAGAVPHAFHVYAGYMMAILVLIHVAAALKHHFIDRDRTLARILPGAEPTPR